MKKQLKIYYTLLASAVLMQIIFTVFSLSQNIGYGQKISFLEEKKLALETQDNNLQTELASKIALSKLTAEENQEFVPITDVVLVDGSSENLALR